MTKLGIALLLTATLAWPAHAQEESPPPSPPPPPSPSLSPSPPPSLSLAPLPPIHKRPIFWIGLVGGALATGALIYGAVWAGTYKTRYVAVTF